MDETNRAGVGAVLTASTPVTPFQGYDSITGDGKSTAVTGATQKVNSESKAQYRVCQNASELAAALEVNQSLTAGAAQIGNISEKMNFLSELNVTSCSISIVVYAKYIIDTTTVTNVSLKPDIHPHTGDGLKGFCLAYGDSYVSSLTTGAEYYAVYTFYSQTQTEKDKLELDMKGHGVSGSGDIDGSFSSNLSKFKSSNSTRMAFNQTIFGIDKTKLPDPAKAIDFASSLPTLHTDAPTIIAFTTSGYESVPAFGDFQSIARNRTFFVGDGGLIQRRRRLQQVKNQIQSIQAIYDFYGGYASDPELERRRHCVDNDLTTITTLIDDYQLDPTNGFQPKDFQPKWQYPDLALPSVSFNVLESRAYGGNGGAPFNDAQDPLSAVVQQQRIASLQLRAGDYVDQLIVEYEQATQKWTETHGGHGGGETGSRSSEKQTLLPGQFITGISGRAGAFVDQLQITLKDGRTVEAGGSGGTPFKWPEPPGSSEPRASFVPGFAGRCGVCLDQISIVQMTLNPATWSSLNDQ